MYLQKIRYTADNLLGVIEVQNSDLLSGEDIMLFGDDFKNE